MKGLYGLGIADLVMEHKRLLQSESSLDGLTKKELKRRCRNQFKEIVVLRENQDDIHIRFQEMGKEILDLREALDRRRQLYKSLEELVNRGQPKSIEDMAIALRNHEKEIVEELNLPSRFKDLEWNELPEEIRDEFVSCLMKIIS